MAAMDQSPVNAAELAAAVEPHAVASWPARVVAEFDGWLLRQTGSYSGRANSVATHLYSGASLTDSIARVESEYRAQGRPVLFQITPATIPSELSSLLLARGYREEAESILMIAAAHAIAELPDAQRSTDDVEVQRRSSASAAFERLTRAGSRSEEDGMERLEILSRVAHAKACFVLSNNGEAVASGACVATGDFAGIYVMRTEIAYRRHGFARRVLREAAKWALAQGARHLYLQVEESNVPARALYASAGFRDGYRYRNYRLD
jgi:ribosomal protein S18 acetylase RimI-like enzyme